MNWLTGLFASASGEIRFRLQDRDVRRAEAARMVTVFPTDELERALDDARGRLSADLERRFDGPMRNNRASLQSIRAVDVALAADLATLTRDHSGELQIVYGELDRLKSDMASAKEAVRDASDDLRRAKGRVSAWHSRSKSRMPFYGKRGKPIPQHSFFVFSYSDLESAKRDANRAADGIGDAIRARDRVFGDMKRCGEVIGEIKDSRAKRRALLDAGRTRTKIVAESAALQAEIIRLAGAEDRMRALRERYVATSSVAVEIQGLEERIRDAHARRKDHLKAFVSADARTSRRDAYRMGAATAPPE